MPTEDKKYIRIQILISLLTLLFTPILSGLVVSFQLSKQQRLWIEQRKMIKSDDMQTKKIQLFNDLCTAYMKYLLAVTNYNLNDITSVSLMARGKLAEDSKVLFFDTILGLRPSSEEYERIGAQLLQNSNDYYAAEGQLRSCLTLVSTTFSDDVARKVWLVNDAIKISVHDVNQKNEFIPKYEKILWELQKTRDIIQYNKSISEFTKMYLSIGENEKLQSAMALLIASMRTEANIH